MNVMVERSRIIKPLNDTTSHLAATHIPLSVFDKVTFDAHIAAIYAYHPPTPPTCVIELGLQKTLAIYPEMAGRLGKDENGNFVIFLNDKGVRFIEAKVESALDHSILLKPSPVLLTLHPTFKDEDDVIQIQITRFTCGSMVIGFGIHDQVADGRSVSSFLVAWGRVTREVGVNSLPFRDRTVDTPRSPPFMEYEHEDSEFMSKRVKIEYLLDETLQIQKDVVVENFHFTQEFLTKLKAIASSKNVQDKPYSTFQSLVAHLWRVMTRARNLHGSETTLIRIAIDGHMRLIPRASDEHFGVLWALPTAKVEDLLCESLPHATKLIHDAIIKVKKDYFRSIVDFADDEAIEGDLIPTTNTNKPIFLPDLEVESWLSFPAHNLDFGTGGPFSFMPSFYSVEGMILLVPSSTREGGIDAFIPLLKDNLPTFRKFCYAIDFMQPH
ncbi:agmatine hydroxycinnamoyltransferase 1-like [Lycium barbarum]|uniref:agmatine hydroxycinnamoyltransferase 1-like n=1 Tax=Lycium barbarum TaxID=112863 RepID=UPI00293E2735|nr:agmatine hydroxycinnamoyltransferase 1-like [Lycium barbarum]